MSRACYQVATRDEPRRRAWALFALLALAAPLVAHAKEQGPARPLTLLFVGGAHGDASSPTLVKLRGRLATAKPDDTVVVFTGNYASGELPPEGEPGREAAEQAVQAHVAAVRDFVARGGAVYFQPGHLDFAEGGTKAVRRLRRALNASLKTGQDDEKRDVMPDAACGDSKLLELSANVGLLLVNSQWWMQQTSGDPNFNDACDAKSRNAFLGNITDAMRSWRSRRLVISTHHPLMSRGEFGGSFTAQQHAEPVPVVGTALVLARESGLVPQYQSAPIYSAFASAVKSNAQRYGSFIFVSGHDANLQSIALGRQLQLISGTSAAQARPVGQTIEGDFAEPSPGWVELALDENGEGEARLVRGGAEVVFTRPLPPVKSLADVPESPPPPLPDGPVMATWSKDPVWSLPGPVRFFVGSYYSEAFHLSLPYDVLDLEALGLEAYKIGGGQQSNSLHLHDVDGGDWVIRSTTKDASRIIPYPLGRIVFLQDVLEYSFTATHPEAALSVSRLADTVGVLNVRPKLLYLPDQPALGRYRGFITDEVVMLEQRPREVGEGHAPPEHLGGRDENTRYESYDDTVEKVLARPEKNRVDQEAMLRSRLLDLFVGDWDRHRGQWRFAINEDERGVKIYSPVAMDRDQAFSQYDGAGLFIARLMLPQSRQPRAYSDDYGPLPWLNYNARDVDALMLNRVGHDRWLEIAAELKATLTDAAIDDAMSVWHPEAYELDGARIARAMKARREKLLEVAEEFYRRQARNVDVPGSMHDDVFELSFEAEGRLHLTVRPRGEPAAEAWYVRTFDPGETDELRLYALDGDDVLELKGAPHERINVRFVGGEGRDEVVGAAMKAGAVTVYDRSKGMRVASGVKVEDERSERASLNQYDPSENHEPDYGWFIPGLLINPDVGVYLGGTYTHVVPGYKTSPFGAQHVGSAFFATSTLGMALDYHGLFPQSMKGIDQLVDLTVRTPGYTRNFYGLTNDFRAGDQPSEYWRVRQSVVEARYGGATPLGANSRIGAQLLGQVFDTQRTAGRYIEIAPDVTDDAFGPRGFFGGRVFLQGSTLDKPMFPRRGVAFRAVLEGRYDVVRGNGFSATGLLSGAVVFPLEKSQRVVVISSASLEGIAGPHPFYFAATLGTRQLRGYAQQQLSGDVAFAHTTDLRIDVFRFRAVLPSTVGVMLSADHGRVWNQSTPSNTYHLSLGGGVWWSLLDYVAIQLSYHRGLDGGGRFSASLGPLFADPNL